MNTAEIRKTNLINLYNEKGEKHGLWEYHYGNGQIWCRGDYVNDKEHGYWEWHLSDGSLRSKGDFVDGKKHGYWEEYYSNGVLRYKEYYDMGKRVSYNPDEPKVVELTLPEIAAQFGIPVEQLRIKK